MDVDADGVDAPTAACDGFGTAAAASDASAHVSASERRAVYARLAWLPSYRDAYALEAEQSSDLIAHLSDEFISAYARRKILSGSEDGQRLAEAHQARLRDSAGVLLRTQNVHHVPFSQAVKSIAFLASVTPKPIWLEARKKRQVVKREWAVQLLDEMLTCRPLPPYDVADTLVLASIGFDQTYLKAGGTTGISRYSGLQTVDAEGNQVSRERMVYINGQHFPTPAACANLSPAALALIAQKGPYTEDFANVLPLLQPARMDQVMDGLLERAVALLGGGPGISTRDHIVRLLGRPPVDPGGATYIVYLPPLLNTDTKSYQDMIKIVDWAEEYLGGAPTILHLIGDGQSVMRLRDLKRRYPWQYKHVVVGNGHFHSGAHSQFADCFLWWEALLCTCMQTIGKVDVTADGPCGTVRPDIKSLESNSAEHTQQGLLAVAVAIIIFFAERVTNPPPAIFRADPVLFISRLHSGGALVLAEFLRHVGLPTVFWQRGTRAMDPEGKADDELAGHVPGIVARVGVVFLARARRGICARADLVRIGPEVCIRRVAQLERHGCAPTF